MILTKYYTRNNDNTDIILLLFVSDLQMVLIAPQEETSSFYYKRKFALTYCYGVGKEMGYCYVEWIWGQKVENEIATCLFKFNDIKAKRWCGLIHFLLR